MSLAEKKQPRPGLAGELIGRFRTDWLNQSHTRAFFPVLEGVLDLATEVPTIRTAIEKSGRYSPAGVIDATRADIEAKILPDLRKLVDRFNGFMEATKGKRAAISPKPVDRQDTYALAIRQEVRQHLRTLDRPGLASLLFGDPDDIVIEAVLEVPAALVSPHLDAEIRNTMLRTWVERRHPEKLAEVEQQEEAGKLIEQAVAHAFGTIRDKAGFNGPTTKPFDEWMAAVANSGKKSPHERDPRGSVA